MPLFLGIWLFPPFPIPSSDNQKRAPGKEPFQPQCPTATRHIWHYELSCGKSFKPKITVSGNVCLQLIILSANHVCILIQILTLNMSLCIVIFPAALLSFTRIYLETFYLNQFLLRFYSVQWRAFLLILKKWVRVLYDSLWYTSVPTVVLKVLLSITRTKIIILGK